MLLFEDQRAQKTGLARRFPFADYVVYPVMACVAARPEKTGCQAASCVLESAVAFSPGIAFAEVRDIFRPRTKKM
jgi:hypothetical protein